MNFKEVLKIKSERFVVALGYNNDNIIEINIEDKPSIIITGSTGTSKSCLLHQILLQLISKNNYNDLKIISIAPTRVELNPYSETNYSYFDVISEKSEALTALKKINNLIIDRKKLFLKNDVLNFKLYNEQNGENRLPFIIVAIDEATDILKDKIASDILLKLIESCKGCGVALIMNTNNVYNDFFEENINKLASCKISFDFVSSQEDKLVNLNNAHNLNLGKFLIRIENERKQNEYNAFEFDDNSINEVLNIKS